MNLCRVAIDSKYPSWLGDDVRRGVPQGHVVAEMFQAFGGERQMRSDPCFHLRSATPLKDNCRAHHAMLMDRHFCPHCYGNSNQRYRFICFLSVLVIFTPGVFASSVCEDSIAWRGHTISYELPLFHKKINFVATSNRRTANPAGWEEYDGSIYHAERGYGWLTGFFGHGGDRGPKATITLEDGTSTSLEDLGRLELANWQGTHQENQLLVFRIDLPNGWYRISCTSVQAGSRGLPLVDQRSFKCRAHDVVFAGANYGAPLVVGGDRLIEGCGVVEVTDGHLRIVVGDPAYGGWTWRHRGPWYQGWRRWWGFEQQYAHSWYQKLRRVVDPGFHHLRLNSLVIEQIGAPAERPSLTFRDFFNRDDSPDINAGVVEAERWARLKLHPNLPADIRAELSNTAITLTRTQSGAAVIGLLQPTLSPADGVVRYSTRVSLFTGEGSRIHSGAQEAGMIILADPQGPTEFNSTFVGVGLDSRDPEALGRLIYRVGDGRVGYRTNLAIPDTALPFKVTEGEFEIIVDHDVATNVLRRMRVNGIDVTDQWALQDRRQHLRQGRFGLRSMLNTPLSKVRLRQFYWYYRVEKL
jgi:hypothetical protein